MRGERIVVPPTLQANILAAAHEGHPGRKAMLRQMIDGLVARNEQRHERIWRDMPRMCSSTRKKYKTTNDRKRGGGETLFGIFLLFQRSCGWRTLFSYEYLQFVEMARGGYGEEY